MHLKTSQGMLFRTVISVGTDSFHNQFTLLSIFFRAEPKVKWRSRQGLLPDEVSYFPSMSYGKNSFETLTFSGVVVFTDAYLPIRKLIGKQYYCI